MAKRTRVRTHTLGAGWEERFLAAVRKARDQKLIALEGAEKLRAFAGAYFCVKCKKEHRTESDLGKQHLRLQPKAAPAPVEAAEATKERGAARPRAQVANGPGAKPKVQRTLDGEAVTKPKAKRRR